MNSKNIFSKIAYLYITLPFLIFIIGWTKWFIAVPVSIAIVYTLFRLFQKEDFLWQPNWDSNSIRLFFLIVIIIGIWVYFSGIGGFAFQNDDHRWRNEIFQMLVWYDWPLVKDVTINNLAETRGMIYYIGFWLPSAIIGKIFGMRAGYLFQMLWAILGLTLVYYYVCAYIKKLSVYPLLAMIFFSGLDIVGYYMVNNDLNGLTNNSHIEFWCGFAQYSSMTTQLFWVFNQAFYAWLITCILLAQKDNRQIIFIWSLAMLNSTFPFVGMIPFLLYKIIANDLQYDVPPSKKIVLFFKEICTPENIVAGGTVGIISFIYLIGNISANNVETSTTLSVGFVFLAFFFFLVEAGLYLFVMYPYQQKNALYYLVILVLLICPYINVGSGKDFSMRASIPALFIMYLLFIETFSACFHKKKYIIILGFMLLFLIGSITPLKEFNRTAHETYCMYNFGVDFPVQPVSEEEIIGADNFSGSIQNNFFFEYLAK